MTARRLLGSGYHAALEARVTAVNQAQAELQRALAPAAGSNAIESYDDLPIEQRVAILWRGEGPDDLPRRGRDNGPVRAYAA